MNRQTFILIIFTFVIKFCCGQQTYIAHYSVDKKLPIEKRVLVDSVNKVKFILDSTQTLIIAIDFNDKKIWSTNPHRDNHINNYRTEKPKIISFRLINPDPKRWDNWNDKSVIGISYSNSQFGLIDLKTGQFNFLGQD